MNTFMNWCNIVVMVILYLLLVWFYEWWIIRMMVLNHFIPLVSFEIWVKNCKFGIFCEYSKILTKCFSYYFFIYFVFLTYEYLHKVSSRNSHVSQTCDHWKKKFLFLRYPFKIDITVFCCSFLPPDLGTKAIDPDDLSYPSGNLLRISKIHEAYSVEMNQ